ncbi:iron chelate uptake ABC transporter family permease subunit [Oricola thermophila]|uniref:Iron chelate uptake ABC transporter family permease subunit n=1 Tax=Oricola thermophila TaxID=2742145 RepID=A0A6N1V8I5_9HYPH|nr:iron chelate uptake ABC transporter family permease subunit [Oricola thermophila]QKV17234.1 iron chelate uptake ABC transporter family permease subunit [Oricola thermophila]
MPERRLAWLALALVGACALFMTLGARGNWDFVLAFRGAKLAALLIVGAAIAVSTILFQTISGNRILTPSIMGFDALFVLFQTLLVFAIGGFGVAQLSQGLRFAMEFSLLLGAAVLLFGTLLSRARHDMHRTVLTGIIFGVLFHSLTAFIQRLIDPNEFAIVQVNSFARFNAVETDLLGISALLCAIGIAAAWRYRHRLDVIALGRDQAISLGVDHRRAVFAILMIVALLVSVSTALAGPVTFFGLLVSSLAHSAMKTHRHALLLPAAALISGIVLVAGQTVTERILALATPLSVSVEFLGGLVFLLLVLKGSQR